MADICSAPPSDVSRNQAAARTLFKAVADEYTNAATQGKLKEWRDAVCAIAELLAPSEWDKGNG